MKTRSAILALLLTATLTACGGGGGSGSAPPAAGSGTPSAPGATPGGAVGGDTSGGAANPAPGTDTPSTGTGTTSTAPATSTSSAPSSTTTTASTTTSTAAAPAPLSYGVRVLEPLDGHDQSAAYGINNQGVVVGYSVAADSLDRQPFIYQDGQMRPALAAPVTESVTATMITDRGLVAGSTYQPRARDGGGAMVIVDGAHRRISTGGGRSNGMNIDGKLVVNTSEQSYNPDAQAGESPFIYKRYCFIYQDGNITNLTDAIGASSALGINTAGDVVGAMPDGSGYLYAAGKVSTLPTLPSDTINMPLAINDQGEIVGASGAQDAIPRPLDPKHGVFYSNLPPWRAYAIRNGAIRQLGTQLDFKTSVAFAITNNGVALGHGYRGEELVSFLSRRDGSEREVSNLPELAAAGVTDAIFYGLNEAGQLVGAGTVNGKRRGLLLTPQP